MAFDEGSMQDQIRSLQTQLATAKQQYEPILERYTNFKGNFGVKEKSDGTIVIDYDKFVERLGMEGALALRAVIDERYKVSGGAGQKPRVRLPSAA